MALRSIAAEVGGILRVTDRTVQQRIGEAREIVECYPAALAEWEAGVLTRGHVRVIVEAGAVVPAEHRAEFERQAIERCQVDTPNRVRPGWEILAERTADRSFTERHREACGFADLLLAGSPSLDPTATGDGPGVLGAIRAQVQVIVPALTLLGADDGPADLVGRSPIDADTARCWAANAPSWTRVLTEPVEGAVLTVDRYRTPWPQRRYLRARDQHCRFPGAAGRRSAARWTIRSTRRSTGRPPCGTSHISVNDITA